MAIDIWVRNPERLRRRGWSFVLWGAALLVFGAAVLVWPELTGTALVLLIGAIVFVAGLVLMWGAWRLRDAAPGLWLAAMLPALAVAVFGAVVLLFPDAVSTILLVMVAVLMVLAGAGDIASSLALISTVRWWWLRLLRGLLIGGAGVWLIFADVPGLVAVGALVGLWAIVLGAITVATGVLALRA